jgi:hypothetical protein
MPPSAKKKGKKGASTNPPIPPEPRLYAVGKDAVEGSNARLR